MWNGAVESNVFSRSIMYLFCGRMDLEQGFFQKKKERTKEEELQVKTVKMDVKSSAA